MLRTNILIACLLVPLILRASGDGQELIGRPAPKLQLKKWINSAPLDIPDLKGKVVLLRWWTDTCELCAATAPALRKLEKEYGDRGLVVIGIFHPKPAGDEDLARVQRASAKYQFTFPVALDADWSTLKRWWLAGGERDYTSVSFVVDKRGIIRYIQPGGEYHEGGGSGHAACRRDFKDIDAIIAQLLIE